MKKTLLMVGLLASAMAAQAQVTTLVLQPSDLAGPLEFTFPTPTDWGTQFPDMTILANAVQQFAVIGQDSTGCTPLTNAADVSGKIAILYRGTCEFGLKALTAQDAGAIGVVIVNNIPGAPIAMGGGVNGASVTIPTVMIGQADGANIHDAVMAGTVEMYIGTVQSLYANNLAVEKKGVLNPTYAAYPKILADNLSFPVGSWVVNFGSADQTGVSLNAKVMHNGSAVYDQTSTAASIANADSAFFQLPDFTQSSFDGTYELTYSVLYGNTDEYESDNTFSASIVFDTLFTYAPIDPNTNFPKQNNFYKPTGISSWQLCTRFSDPQAHKVKVSGFWAAATYTNPGNMLGQALDAHFYLWNDAVTTTTSATFDNLDLIMDGTYVYADSLSDELPVFIPLNEAQTLVDNQAYLFCVSTNSADVFMGTGSGVDYLHNNLINGEIGSILDDGTQFHTLGFGTDITTTIAVGMQDASIGIRENNVENLTPYPNPTAKSLTIPMKGNSGKATLTVFDAKGAQVLNKQVTVGSDNKLTMDLQDFNAGSYLFNMTFENGNRSKFRVVVNK